MNYHIMIQDKFIDGFICDVHSIGEPDKNIFWIRGNKGDTNYISTNHQITYIGYDITEIKLRLATLEVSDVIFVHWYDEFIANILEKQPNKLFVFIWGGEFYETPINYHQKWLFDKRTAKYLHKIEAPKIDSKQGLSILMRSFIERVKYEFHLNDISSLIIHRKKQIQKINYLITLLENNHEVDFIKKLYSANQIIHLAGFYNFNFQISQEIQYVSERRKPPYKIMVGNSASATNNHLDAFQNLKNISAKFYCPLSYGSSSYSKFIIEEGKIAFGENFIPITQYMSLPDYLTFLSSMDIVYMYHNRQQAVGNIFMALSMGKPVFLKKKNIIWDLLSSFGIHCYDAEKIHLYNIAEIIEVEQKKRTSNINILKNYISDSRRLEQLKRIMRIADNHETHQHHHSHI